MLKLFLFFFMLLIMNFQVKGQSIDSVHITNNSTPPSFYVEGTFPHTGFELTRIDYSANPDTVNISIFLKECGGFATITKFDSVIDFDQAFPVIPDYIRFKSFKDSNTVDTSCIQRATPTLVDSLLISQNTFNLENQNVRNRFIKLYPNPVTNQLTIEIEEVRLSTLKVEISDLLGKLVLSEEWAKSNRGLIKKIDLRQLPRGEYIISIGDDCGFHESLTFQKK